MLSIIKWFASGLFLTNHDSQQDLKNVNYGYSNAMQQRLDEDNDVDDADLDASMVVEEEDSNESEISDEEMSRDDMQKPSMLKSFNITHKKHK